MPHITCISDTHTQLSQVSLPSADILVIAGDLTYNGTVAEIGKFVIDLGKIKSKKLFKDIVVISGNHDFLFQNNNVVARSMLSGYCHYLQDESKVIQGLKFYGSPWTPFFYQWAFNLDERDSKNDYAHANRIWDQIPNDTNVLITHGPPRGIQDICNRDERVGCPVLRKRLDEIIDYGHLKLAVWGHLHESYGQEEYRGIKCVNAATCTEKYKPTNTPIVVEINI